MRVPGVTATKSYFRFRLRSLLILVTAVAVVCGTLGRRIVVVSKQRKLSDTLTNEFGAQVQWQFHPGLLSLMSGSELAPGQPAGWLKHWIGDDFFGDVVKMSLHYNRQIANDDLAQFGRFPRLKNLDLSLTGVDDDGMRYLARLSNLRVLGLGSTGVTERGLAYLREVDELESLDVSFTGCGDTAIAFLAKTFPALERIDLTSTPITDASLQQLVALPNLMSLNLTDTALTPSGIRSLERLKNLSSLALNNTAVDDSCLEALSRLPNLKELYLRDAAVTDEGIQHLAHASKLRMLQLCGTRVSDAGLVHLGRLPSLRRLDLRGLDVTDAGIAPFGGARLDILLVRNTQVTWDGLLGLAAVDPVVRRNLARIWNVSLSQKVGTLPVVQPVSPFQSAQPPPLSVPSFDLQTVPKFDLQPDERLGEFL